jgi:hypothetical protein
MRPRRCADSTADLLLAKEPTTVNDTRRQTLYDLAVFSLLVAIGVAGRWGQPEWCFTPTAAAAIFAGRYFRSWQIAALVPITILAISDVLLPAYGSFGVMVATYVAMVIPVFLGKLLSSGRTTGSIAWRWAACSFVPAVLFFLISNFAVWAFEGSYSRDVAGLVQCYVAAIPFLRWMLAGDIFYMVVLFGCGMLAGLPVTRAAELQTRPVGVR